ncbi:hypothetical protein FOCG_12385 [Fusarium oxysporum f. sp. radicis-lycopersici 26381]|uniref:Uncharacterized protein n=3 Tax=Fusarium oxysporum TaxID=5507 RepID=A0A0J9VJU9_FUSO4|nr:hypothetical protein FOXG_20494 [Fusarium oxysporum f. sp. lycopersici 4287]EWZ49698.1 hypothetical protein FOZG_00550 [Fusarium oxysporum Fo47]EWZ88859.1 hypothetical protein FOWG_08671 [Fusarium oxysporum f. sp. lycopersici MN25]EXK46944.1 hypothetical protein FOMG_00545 [Fusarium oxysporum f. sp. melonis 26406]EXL46506.1 hypothetical protein FOCG_12385 [Fusarium oxysporum f. sp. radicis-lycopersici 26381]KNB11323.1 hypothetical protein FOXG_20494 [Fusarium oxysporum f. sp. lycopersici 42
MVVEEWAEWVPLSAQDSAVEEIFTRYDTKLLCRSKLDKQISGGSRHRH